MSRSLFALLAALTLLDLGFVQATGVVGAAGMLPMWALTLASPWLRRLQRFRVHRFAWNTGVLVAFALLVAHATTSGLLHMLEDGLVLAVLCQVHLLNNVGARQRPDLLFFNSFLVAFVTAFFAPDLSWSLLFLAHALVLLPTLQIYALQTRESVVDPRLLRAALRDCVPRTLVVGLVTATAFVLLPRDFRREGWLGDAALLRRQFEAGLAERIRIDDERASGPGDEVLAHIVPAAGPATDVPTHWRATAFSRFDGTGWSAQEAGQFGSRFASDPPWERHPDGSLHRRLPEGPRARLRVQFAGPAGTRLPTPLAASHVTGAADESLLLDGRSDGCLRLTDAEGRSHPPLAFDVEVAATAGAARNAERVRSVMTALPLAGMPDAVHELAGKLRALLPPAPDALARATAASDWLQHNRRYGLPGRPGFARDLRAFLANDGAGHCEYFATALALVLRVQGVPCRLVGGWLVHEREAGSGSFVVRGRHAHAWVEVLDEDGRWHTFDATPAADVRAEPESPTGWWHDLRKTLEAWWTAVTTFDQATRARWLAAALALPRERPLTCVGAVAVIAFLVLRRRRRAAPEVLALERALRAAGLALQPGETPREALARASATQTDARRLAALREAAAAHERRRYAPG